MRAYIDHIDAGTRAEEEEFPTLAHVSASHQDSEVSTMKRTRNSTKRRELRSNMDPPEGDDSLLCSYALNLAKNCGWKLKPNRKTELSTWKYISPDGTVLESQDEFLAYLKEHDSELYALACADRDECLQTQSDAYKWNKKYELSKFESNAVSVFFLGRIFFLAGTTKINSYLCPSEGVCRRQAVLTLLAAAVLTLLAAAVLTSYLTSVLSIVLSFIPTNKWTDSNIIFLSDSKKKKKTN
jgi:hypothetical protein